MAKGGKTKGSFVKGDERAGRPKGCENKVNLEARKLFVSTLEGQVPYLNEAFETVRQKDPAKYLEIFGKYAQYFIPKQLDINTENVLFIPPIIQFETKTKPK